MTRDRSWWLAVIESYPCPTCGVGPGDRCITNTGQTKNEPHAPRTQLGDRCPRCGSHLAADALEPLCDRCLLVRRLEVERATRYVRRDDR